MPSLRCRQLSGTGKTRALEVSTMEEDGQVADDAFCLELPSFEGPLDLLLHLIQSHELDILDLPIAFITERYLDYLGLFQNLKLDVVSEYLVMAATLAHIKSKMLLPAVPTDQEDDSADEQLDPREELVRRLLEYQKYKAAAEGLAGRGLAGRDVFTRGAPAQQAEGPAPLGNMTLFSLLDAFNRVLKRANADLAREITAERVTIQDRMAEIIDLLNEKKRIPFEELFEGYVSTYDLVVTFMAMLEMAKTRLLRLFQSDPYSPIYIEGAFVESGADDSHPRDEGASAHADKEEDAPHE